ncbi:hypothetical protein BJF81_10665 [Ornithinimicrobium sp. CNJ-824]|nr:hypothetical protein BJF81_10665 [Ornithinimicrobium sp. CNJ-824]
MTRLPAAPPAPTVSWDDLQIPLPPLPPMPDLPFLPGVPDFWGTPMQWLVAVPALTALAVITLSGRSNRLAAWLGVGGGLVTFLAALWQLVVLVRVDGRHVSGSVGALPLGELTVPLGLQVDWPLGLVAVAVALVALVVQVYGRWYLWYDPRYTVFAATVAAFTAAMLLTVLADDVLLLLVGWEVMGWCSYLLIGHHSTRAAARRAALKALLVTRTADVGVVLGLVVLAAGAGTTSLTGIVEHWSGVAEVAGEAGSPGPALTAAMVLLVVGVAGKSALFPFQDWLPDAMEGPTPASALIHAATMVAAGTVVLVHLFPLLAATDTARTLLAVLAAVTMLGAALLAFAQGDLKRLLAWSTVSQVALMLGASRRRRRRRVRTRRPSTCSRTPGSRRCSSSRPGGSASSSVARRWPWSPRAVGATACCGDGSPGASSPSRGCLPSSGSSPRSWSSAPPRPAPSGPAARPRSWCSPPWVHRHLSPPPTACGPGWSWTGRPWPSSTRRPTTPDRWNGSTTSSTSPRSCTRPRGSSAPRPRSPPPPGWGRPC